jgi:hypothetical protein
MGDIMRLTLVAAAAALGLSGTAAFAWGDMYMGDGTNNPNSNFLVYSYNAPNYCPAGLQPVVAGGVICCGTPNAGAYYTHPAKKAHRPTPTIVVGEKGVVYR